MTTTEDLIRLVRGIPSERLDEARQRLDPLVDPVLFALENAPLDDEPFTDEERAELEEARVSIERGEWIPLEEAARELGIDLGELDDVDVANLDGAAQPASKQRPAAS